MLCIVNKWQHNSEQGSRLDHFSDQYQERAVRNQLWQMIGQLNTSRLTHTHTLQYFFERIHIYTFNVHIG